MPAKFTTLPHFSVSAAMNLPKSTGERAVTGDAQVGKSRFHICVGEARIDLFVESVDDLSGVPLGAPTPNQALDS